MQKIEAIAAEKTRITIQICGACACAEGQRYLVDVRMPYAQNEPALRPERTIFPSIHVDLDQSCAYLSFSRYAQEQDLLFCKFHVYVETSGTTRRLDGPCYATQLDRIARWDYAYPCAGTKKGLQVKVMEDALQLGIGHAALNVNLPCIVQASGDRHAIEFHLDGRTFYFNRAYMEMLDQKIRTLSDRNVVVNLIILVRSEWHGVWGNPELTPVLLHPALHPDGIVSAFHVTSERAWTLYRACLEFLAERYMGPDPSCGRACGWIIGNEVNAQWIYSNCGEMEMSEFIRQYQIALRTAFYAARKYYAQARVYVSLDHCWNIRTGDNDLRFYKGKDFLRELAARIRSEGDFSWNLAYHPFPQDLSRADFWNDGMAERNVDTPKITFRNIEILPEIMAQAPFLYAGQRRHIILSEQGLCSGHTPADEQLQADAFVLAYRKIAEIPEIDAFIYHSHIDEKKEGLFLGLLAEDGRKKPIHACFAAIDGPEGETLFRRAKARVGEENCEKIQPSPVSKFVLPSGGFSREGGWE